MTNKEKFLELVSKEKTSTLKEIKKRIKNRAMLRESQQIALKVLLKIDELGWSQKVLADKMKVKPQYLNRVLRGQENITLDTQVKLQEILNVPILASYYEKKFIELEEFALKFTKKEKYVVAESRIVNYESGVMYDMKYDHFTNKYSFKEAI